MSYFLRTITDPETKNVRVRALKGQTIGTTAVDSSKNVSCDKDVRSRYPVGSVFACRNLEDTGKGFYKVSDFHLYPVAVDGRLFTDGTITPATMLADYQRYSERMDGEHATLDGASSVSSSLEENEEDGKEAFPTLISRLRKRKELKEPSIDTDGFYVDPSTWWLLVRNVRHRKNTIMIGDSGTGKTELIYRLATVLGKELAVFDMGAMQDPLTGLLGTHRIVGKESAFDYAKFTKDIQEDKIILLDEISRAPANANNILFPCLDSRRELPVEIASSDSARNIKIHPDCTFFATANIGAEYTGTGLIDRALMERFFPCELTYLPKAIEAKVLQKRTGVQAMEAELICSYADKIRDLYLRGELSIGVSIRHTLEVASMVVDGFKLLNALEMVFLPPFEGTKKTGERSIIAALITSK